MIKAILTGIINLLIGLVNLVIAPIDAIINASIPSLSSAFNAVDTLFDYMVGFVGWVIDASCLPPVAIEIIVITITARLTVPLLVHTIKLAMNWYDKLKV